jgi:plastocyanin domain-containing protein
MDPAAIWVTTGGLALAVAVNLYFFGARSATVAGPAAAEGPQEVRVAVAGGYQPSVIEVRAGQPVRLVFRREEVAGCSDTVLLPAWGIAQRLPAHQDTVVEFTPQRPGEYEFTCGMHMLRGTIVVR